MPKAAFCSECGVHVWVSDDGGCANGHPRSCLGDEYEISESDDDYETAAAEDALVEASPVAVRVMTSQNEVAAPLMSPSGVFVPAPAMPARVQGAAPADDEVPKAIAHLAALWAAKIAGAGVAILWFLWLWGRVGIVLAVVITIPSVAALPAVPFAMWFFDGAPSSQVFFVWAVGVAAYVVSRMTMSREEKFIEQFTNRR